MCGIAGIVSLDGQPVQDVMLRDMCAAMSHRGPDDDGFYLAGRAGLCMRRLSIIDVKAGHQPISNEDGTVWTVFNGEIYNYRELRRELESRGHRLSTKSDTEVIVHLFEDYGARCVNFLRGMFAFAVWDARRQELLLARDRLGIKPLHYAEVDGRLLFASEIKSILTDPQVERQISWGAMAHLFTFLTTPRNKSILRGIRKLEPAHTLTIAPGRPPRIERYWELKYEPDRRKSAAWFAAQARDLLTESVRMHLVADVPVGAFLSGGLDSSSVVAAAAPLHPARLETFSVGFQEAAHNELDYAREVATKFRTCHRELVLGPDALDELERIVWHLDEPFGDSSAIPTYMVSKLAASHVKVVLSGDGGDELFAGYDKYVVEGRERGMPKLPWPLRAALAEISRRMPAGMRGRNYLRHRSLDGAARYLDASTLFRDDDLRALFEPNVAECLGRHEPWRERAASLETGGAEWLSRLQRLDMSHYLPLDILTKVDRMSMAHSIETRVPLLDHKFVEFTATIPPEMNVIGGGTKAILKRAMRGVLPDRIIHRPKHGFAAPLNYWFRGELKSIARDLLLGDSARRRGLFRPNGIEALLRRHENGRDLDLQIWTLMSFELWARTFLDRPAGNRRSAAA